jgi:nitrite reductase/ring-hydroxylating ferredoxin subunit
MHQVFTATDAGQSAPFKILLLRSGSEIKAFANRCAHFGVPLAAQQEQLKFQPHTSITCNVHYARYRWSDGICDKGECEGEALIAIPVQVDAQGRICIAPAA